MVLASLFEICNLKFEVAHINYKLRGEDSDLDQKLVEDFCKKNEIKLHLHEVSEKDKKPKHSIQIWARNLRYDFFRAILIHKNIDYLVTAHHLNDELETFIINLSRGSGIKGLSGIPANENQILRPLLHFTKEEIYDFAKQHQIDFREDKSNEKDDYLRNKIRNQLTPKILEVFPRFLEQFNESLSHLSAVNRFYQDEIERVLQESLISGNDDEFTLDKEVLFQQKHILIVEIIRKLGFSGIEIEKIISAENSKFFRSSTYEISIKKKAIYCKRKLKF